CVPSRCPQRAACAWKTVPRDWLRTTAQSPSHDSCWCSRNAGARQKSQPPARLLWPGPPAIPDVAVGGEIHGWKSFLASCRFHGTHRLHKLVSLVPEPARSVRKYSLLSSHRAAVRELSPALVGGSRIRRNTGFVEWVVGRAGSTYHWE